MTKTKIDSTKQSSIKDDFAGTAFVVLLTILVLLQGGFYAESSCVIGGLIVAVEVIVFIFTYRRHTVLRIPLAAYLFLGIAVAALIGSALLGLNASFVIESSIWFFAAAAAILSAFIQKSTREHVFIMLGWVGIASAVLAILMFAGLLPLEGSENMGRLLFTFQYANAAGIWFAVMAILAIVSNVKRLRIGGYFPLVALLFTQSVGAISIFVIAVVVVLIRWAKEGNKARIWALLMQLLCAFAACGVQIAAISDLVLSPLPVLGGFGVLLLLRRYIGPVLEDRSVSSKMLLVVSMGFLSLAVVMCLVALAYTGRLLQASQTFIERILQTQDAMELLKQGFFFGTGPGSWAYLYQGVQSVQYTASVVHNSYAQIAMTSGIIGLGLFLIIAIKSFLQLRKMRDWHMMLMAAMMLFHFLIDFDLQFASLLMLFILFVVPSQEEKSQPSFVERFSIFSVIFICALCALGCAAGLWAQMQKNELLDQAQQGDWQLVEQRLGGDEFMAQDPEMRALYLKALINLGDYSKAASVYNSWDHTTANEATLAAFALYQAGSPLQAEEVLVSKLLEQPKNIDFFDEVAEIFQSRGASDIASKRFTDAARAANQPNRGLGSLMTNQKKVLETLDEYPDEELIITK